MRNLKYYTIQFCIGCTITLGGCVSLWEEERTTEYGFRQKMAPARTAPPLPVEIAQEIAAISEDGVIHFNANTNGSPEDFTKKKVVSESDQEASSEEATNLERVIGESGPLVKAHTQKGKGPLGFAKIVRKVSESDDGRTVNYIVKLGDTLMEIAFEKYGNYLRWKEIYKVNRHKMSHYRKMRVGTELTLNNVKYVYIRRKGRPYLIRKGDTLKSISQKLYGTSDKWRAIWKNNPQLILNPKKIYAGFQLYYASDITRRSAEAK